MRGKKSIIVSMMLCMVTLTACSGEQKFSEEETTIIADYVAQTVLEHSEGYEHKFVDMAENPFELAEEEDFIDSLNNDDVVEANADDTVEVDKKEALAKNDVANEDDESNEADNDADVIDAREADKLSKILGFEDGIEVNMGKSKELIEYASESYIIDVEQDEKLVQVVIELKNTTNKDILVKTPATGIKYKLIIDEDEYSPLLTAFENDLVYYEKTIKANKTEKAVLLYKVPKNAKKSYSFKVENNDSSALVPVE